MDDEQHLLFECSEKTTLKDYLIEFLKTEQVKKSERENIINIFNFQKTN